MLSDNKVLQGDCLEIMQSFPDNHFDSIVTDPPYGLEFMGKEWDSNFGVKKGGDRRQSFQGSLPHRDNPYGRTKVRSGNGASYGTGVTIMHAYQQWCEQWAAECLRILKPGGHLLAFGGTRTYHRLACAIEDAGFEIRDSLHWIYGSGFPKSLDVSKAIDKAAGVEREDKFGDSFTRFAGPSGNKKCDTCGKWLVSGSPCKCPRPQDAAVTSDAQQWEGWGTALKPAHEPVVVARKPLTGTVAANVLEWGTGGLNIDGCRVEGIKDTPASPRRAPQGPAYSDLGNDPATGSGWDPNTGRFPPNILLSDEAVQELDRQSGQRTSGSGNFKKESSADFSGNAGPAYGAESRPAGTQMISYGDTGGASRFFPCFKYNPKAAQKERPKVDGIAHPTCKPVALMQWLVRLVTPPGGMVLDPFAGTGTTGQACRLEGFGYVLIEKEADYIKLINARLLAEPSLFDEVM